MTQKVKRTGNSDNPSRMSQLRAERERESVTDYDVEARGTLVILPCFYKSTNNNQHQVCVGLESTGRTETGMGIADDDDEGKDSKEYPRLEDGGSRLFCPHFAFSTFHVLKFQGC